MKRKRLIAVGLSLLALIIVFRPFSDDEAPEQADEALMPEGPPPRGFEQTDPRSPLGENNPPTPIPELGLKDGGENTNPEFPAVKTFDGRIQRPLESEIHQVVRKEADEPEPEEEEDE